MLSSATLLKGVYDLVLSLSLEPRGIYSLVSEVQVPPTDQVIWRTVGIPARITFVIQNEDGTESDLFVVERDRDMSCARVDNQPLLVKVFLRRSGTDLLETDIGVHRVRLRVVGENTMSDIVTIEGMHNIWFILLYNVPVTDSLLFFLFSPSHF